VLVYVVAHTQDESPINALFVAHLPSHEAGIGNDPSVCVTVEFNQIGSFFEGGRALHDLAAEIRRVSEAARNNKSPREELTGSTITVTSLGKLGGIASTPMINMPEVSIIGINKAIERAVVVDGQITVRLMMNLSSSFDHRFVDGFDAASMIQALKDSLEQPATIFIDG